MKYWSEINEDIFSYFDLEKYVLTRNLEKDKIKLGVFSINASMMFDLDDNKKFLEICNEIVRKIFKNHKSLDDYKLYLLANIKLDNPNSKVARYRKIWKLIQKSWDVSEFKLGTELEMNSEDKLYYTSIAQFEFQSFLEVLEMVSKNPTKYTIIASKNNDLITSESIASIFKLAFNGYGIKSDEIDFINLAINLYKREDIIFRWGTDSEEVELALIFDKKIIKYFK